jgi:hypothetical protein
MAIQQIAISTMVGAGGESSMTGLAQSFESFCLLRSLESELRLEDSYDFVKFMLTL